ncbi:MAG: class E sortase [Actinomycetota bacterium]|nr:class E sortase [Actinomycetota bacterium]
MTRKLPETGSAALTYDDAADIGVFDGRIVTPKKRPRSAAPSTRSRPEKAAPAEPPTEPEDESSETDKKGFIIPLVAGLVLVVVGAVAVIYPLVTVVVSDRVAARAQVDLRVQFEERQTLAAEGQLDSAFDPSAVPAEPEIAPTAEGFDTADDVPVIFGTPSAAEPVVDPVVDPRVLPEWLTEVPPPRGEPLGRIVVPTAGIDWVVVEGVNPDDLRKGPGHMPGTAMPGQYGNAVLSGHRTTYGAPFGHLDRLQPGDRFTVETLIGVHTYQVVSIEVVNPTDTWVVQPMEGSWLTLITCTPKYTSRQRLIVFSKLVDGPNLDAVAETYGTRYERPRKPLPFESTPTPAG